MRVEVGRGGLVVLLRVEVAVLALGPAVVAQEAVDRAAMRAGKGGSDAYLADWRRESTEIIFEESPQSAAKKIAEELEQSFSDENIKALIKNKGLK